MGVTLVAPGCSGWRDLRQVCPAPLAALEIGLAEFKKR